MFGRYHCAGPNCGSNGNYHSSSTYCGDAVPAKKPAPDVYLLAAEKLAVPTDGCVVIEDSGIGLAAAKAAAMACCVTMSTYTSGEDFSAADLVVPELESAGVNLDKLKALL